MNHELSLLDHGFSVEQAQLEPSLIGKNGNGGFSKGLDGIPESSKIFSGGFGGIGSIVLFCTKVATPLIPGSSTDLGEKWRVSKKGEQYLETLVQQETLAAQTQNYHAIIFYLALLLEHELNTLIVNPLKPFTPELCDLLKNKLPLFRTDAIEQFAKGKLKPTFWTSVALLRGLEVGVGHYSSTLSRKLDTLFEPSYILSLRQANLSKAADTFRWKYRNPSCHPEQAVFDAEEAKQACKLVLGYTTVAGWGKSSSDPQAYRPSLLSTHLIMQKA